MATSPAKKSPQATTPPRSRAKWTLRRRLTVTLAGLLVAASVIVGVVSVLSLRSFLTSQLDQQLTDALSRSTSAVGMVLNGNPNGANGPQRGVDRDNDGDHASGALLAPGQASGTLVVVSDGQSVSLGRVLDRGGNLATISDNAVKTVTALPANHQPSSVTIPTLGDYRVVTVAASTGETLSIGLPLAPVNAATTQLIIVILSVTVLSLGVMIIAGRMLIRFELKPLDRVTDVATRVAALPLDKGEVDLGAPLGPDDTDPRTEVGRVGAAFNNMLGHIGLALTARQNSEEKVRRFVADASHELRTPLASIRGYAELTRRGGEKLPTDVQHSLNRIESEAKRMTTLVEDLLLLARLDEGRELQRVPVDTLNLLEDVVSDAQAAGPDHIWKLTLPASAKRAAAVDSSEFEILGDPERLHQVLLNLLANARIHTPAGTTVAVGLKPTVSAVEISVSDNGPGIPAAQLNTLFERFTRGDASRTRATGSTGLGLAIVKAVVTAHNGTVSVVSKPKKTQFTVTLPKA